MRDYEQLVTNIITPLVKNPASLLVRKTVEDKKIIINIFGESEDIAVLIGRRGVIANALREVASVAGKLDEEHVYLKFESFSDNK
ncbi:MAG TPA: KH domain-containing protein [Bacilli bacterium]|nr:KH domain-containing protein [Bacilli bacterium]